MFKLFYYTAPYFSVVVRARFFWDTRYFNDLPIATTPMDDSMVTRITPFCVLLPSKCCGSHTSETSYCCFCLDIVYIQGFNLMVAKFACVSLCDRGTCENLGYSHYIERTCKNGPCFNSLTSLNFICRI